jgi:hypothetical protein
MFYIVQGSSGHQDAKVYPKIRVNEDATGFGILLLLTGANTAAKLDASMR